MSGAEEYRNPHAFVDADSWVDPLQANDVEVTADSVLMEETVTFNTRQAIKRACLNMLWLPTVMASLIGGVGLIMSIGFALAGLLPPGAFALRMAILPFMLFGGTWVLSFVIGVPIVLIACLPTKHRRIRNGDGELIQKTGCRTTKLLLDECSWQVTDRAADIGGRYFGYGPLVQVQCSQTFVVCGFSKAMRQSSQPVPVVQLLLPAPIVGTQRPSGHIRHLPGRRNVRA